MFSSTCTQLLVATVAILGQIAASVEYYSYGVGVLEYSVLAYSSS
jgi:hypothetical protein